MTKSLERVAQETIKTGGGKGGLSEVKRTGGNT